MVDEKVDADDIMSAVGMLQDNVFSVKKDLMGVSQHQMERMDAQFDAFQQKDIN